MNAAKSSTATATTATAKSGVTQASGVAVVGRFAPSPTGPLHAGSLLAAVGSYLQARSHGGRWLLRIEDVDATRTVAGMESQILLTLERFGFEWDGPVVRQSERRDRYAAALAQLQAAGTVFRCECSRRDRLESQNSRGLGCVSECWDRQPVIGQTGIALRWRPTAATGSERDRCATVSFDDLWQGPSRIEGLTDVVLRRRDGLHAYHLAVVVDDADQGVNQIVRGADLLESTGWHILLQRALQAPQPEYGHLPVLTESDGRKLSKSSHAIALDTRTAGPELFLALQRLRQQPPEPLAHAPVAQLWSWALGHWQPARLLGLSSLAADGRTH